MDEQKDYIIDVNNISDQQRDYLVKRVVLYHTDMCEIDKNIIKKALLLAADAVFIAIYVLDLDIEGANCLNVGGFIASASVYASLIVKLAKLISDRAGLRERKLKIEETYQLEKLKNRPDDEKVEKK